MLNKVCSFRIKIEVQSKRDHVIKVNALVARERNCFFFVAKRMLDLSGLV